MDSGKVTALTEGYGCTLEQGEIIFHRPMETHAHVSEKNIFNSMLVVSFTTNSPDMMFFDQKIFKLEKSQKAFLSIFINEIKNVLCTVRYPNNVSKLDFSIVSPESYQLLECYFIALLITLFRTENKLGSKIEHSEAAELVAQNTLLELIIEYMKNNLQASLTLKDICSQFYISNSKLCKLFNMVLEQSPIKYFNYLKIKEAQKLLSDNTKTITDISDSLGYSSIHNFLRAFKNSIGVSPLEYRNKIL